MATTITRRQLLGTSAALGAGLLIPRAAQAGTIQPTGTGPYWDRVLILIEFDGGNDGLNTVIPFSISEYNDRRPTLRYTSTQLAATMLGNGGYSTVKNGVSATQPFALNPAMTHVMSAWTPSTPTTHDLAVVLGVGYPNPNLSHFRSMDIWNGGSDWNQFPSDCWLGRLFNGVTPPTSLTAHGVLLSRYSSNPLRRGGIRYLAMSKPEDFIRQSYYIPDVNPGTVSSPYFQHLLATQHDVFQASGSFLSAMMTKKTTAPTPATKPEHYNYTPPTFSSPGITFNTKSSFEMRCKSIAEMIATSLNADSNKRLQIPVYKVQIGGFDNHSDQKLKQEDLLAQVSSAMASLRAAMIEKGLWDRVLIMSYSEFGRRVEENGSKGTDHGTANAHFLMGGGVKGGLYGSQPGLSKGTGQQDLDSRGNLVANVDYRRLYATAAQWLGLPVDSYLTAGPGEDFSPIPCLV